MEIVINLLRTEPYDDGIRRYIGMYHTLIKGVIKGGSEAIYSNPEKLFDSLRESFGEDSKMLVKSERLPRELEELTWYHGRSVIEDTKLVEIVKNQKKGGNNVELAV